MSASHGRSGLILKHYGQVFVIEAKVVENESNKNVENMFDGAIEQRCERGFGDPYRGRGTLTHNMVLVFGKKARDLIGCKLKTANIRFAIKTFYCRERLKHNHNG